MAASAPSPDYVKFQAGIKSDDHESHPDLHVPDVSRLEATYQANFSGCPSPGTVTESELLTIFDRNYKRVAGIHLAASAASLGRLH